MNKLVACEQGPYGGGGGWEKNRYRADTTLCFIGKKSAKRLVCPEAMFFP